MFFSQKLLISRLHILYNLIHSHCSLDPSIHQNLGPLVSCKSAISFITQTDCLLELAFNFLLLPVFFLFVVHQKPTHSQSQLLPMSKSERQIYFYFLILIRDLIICDLKSLISKQINFLYSSQDKTTSMIFPGYNNGQIS